MSAQSPQPCAAIHALCDLLPEVRAIISLVATSAGVPDHVRSRCIGLHYRLRDALDVEKEEISQ